MPDRTKAIRRMRLLRSTVALALICGVPSIGPSIGGFTKVHAAAPIADRLSGLPPRATLSFEPDLDTHQAHGSFVLHTPDYRVVIGPTSLQIGTASSPRGVRFSYLDANARARITPEGRSTAMVSYFQSRNPHLWKAGLPAYTRLLVSNLYPGIDLAYYISRSGLEYDLIVHPGADPHRIRLSTAGGRLGRQGALVWPVSGGTLALAAPTIYQQGAGHRVAGGYTLSTTGVVSFKTASYDPRHTLVIDPFLKVIGTSGYNSIGGTGTAITVDGAGNTYVTGTGSGQFPTTSGAALITLANQDVADSAIVVMKFNPAGKLLFSTYLGTVVGNGATDMSSAGIAVDGAGNVFVTGATDGADFPLVHPLFSYPPPNGSGGASYHAFVVKLNPTGSKILYSTYLGTALNSRGLGITVDKAGTAYVAGSTYADENPDDRQFPVTAHKRACPPGTDGFVAMLNPTGGKLLSASCIGATGTTRATAISLDSAHNVYVTGYTNIFPPQANLRIVSTQIGVNNIFVVKYDPTQTKVLYSAILGADGDSQGNAIAVDQAGDTYITGTTAAEHFPTTSGAFMPQQNAPNAAVTAAFALAITPAGTKLLYSTYLSGNTAVTGTGIVVDKHGNAFVAGTIARNLNMAVSADQVTFPLTKGAKYTKFNDNGDGFLTELNPRGTSILSSTLLGGLEPGGVALGSNGRPYLTGSSTRQDAQISEAKDTWFVVWAM